MLTLNLIEWLNSLCKLPRRFSHIDESRNLSKGIFIVSGVLFVVGMSLPLPIFECKISNDKIKCEKYISSLSNGLLGVSASLLAASLTDILVGMRDVWIREEKQGKFRIFFGIGKDIAVVIPQFSIQLKLKEDDNLQKLEESLQIELSDKERMMIRANEGFCSSADLQSSISINILFDRVKILSDNTPHEVVKPKLEYTTEKYNDRLVELSEDVLFVIGLFSNVLLMKNINHPHNNNKVFKIEYSEDRTCIIKIANNEQSHELWERVSDNDKFYYGLLARVNVGKKIIFVSGGIKAEITIKCNEFLLENWENIYQKLSHEISSDPLPTDRNFAICMRMKKEEEEVMKSTTLNMNDIYCFCIQESNGKVKFVK